jgi:hypothetical protein
VKRFVAIGGIVIALVIGMAIGVGKTAPPHVAYFHPHDRITNLEARDDAVSIIAITQGKAVPDFAYRVRRPIPIALLWLLAFGQRSWMPYALVPLGIIGAVFLCWVLYDWIGLLGLAVLFCPGTLFTLIWFGPNTLGLGLALVGWRKRDWRLLACAGLIHETLLLFALRRSVKPFLVYGAWAGFVTLRYGWQMHPDTFGFFSAFSAHPQTLSVEIGLASIALGVFAMTDREVRWMSAAYLALALCLGQATWNRPADLARILLPLCVFGLVAIAKRYSPSTSDGSSSAERLVEPVSQRGRPMKARKLTSRRLRRCYHPAP